MLEIAASFEEIALNFYAGLTPKVGKKVRWAVEELAAEEQQHEEMLVTLSARPDIASQVKVSIATPASDGRFSDAVHIPDLVERPDDQTVLQWAMGREHLAMEHCRNLANGVPAGPINLNPAVGEPGKHLNKLIREGFSQLRSS